MGITSKKVKCKCGEILCIDYIHGIGGYFVECNVCGYYKFNTSINILIGTINRDYNIPYIFE